MNRLSSTTPGISLAPAPSATPALAHLAAPGGTLADSIHTLRGGQYFEDTSISQFF